MCSLHKEITAYISNHQDDFMALLRRIISIPSPTGQEGDKAAWVLQYLHDLGESQAYIDEAGNVLCPCQINGHETFPLYNAHIDTVFSKDTDLTVRVDGSILASPSCGDNSAGVAGLLFIIAMIRRLGLTLPQGALFAFNTGEEGLGNLKGMRQIMKDWHGRIADVLAVDCTYDQVVDIPVGSRRYTVTVATEGGHSWMHFGKTNAIAVAASIIEGIYALTVPATPRTTYNVGTISGGTTVNSIAAGASFTVDLRSESQGELTRLDEAFKALLKKAQTPDAAISLTLIGERPCSSGLRADAQCSRITAIRRAYGLETAFISGSTDANIPLSLGVPALSFGICRSHGEHTVKETLELDTVETGLAMLAEYMQLAPAAAH